MLGWRAAQGKSNDFITADSNEAAAIDSGAGPGLAPDRPDVQVRRSQSRLPFLWFTGKRVYNGRFLQNDSDHSYVTTAALYAQMTAQG